MLGCSSLPRALSVRKAHLHTSRTVRSQISSVVDVLEARKLVQATTSRALKDHLQTKHATSTFLPRTIYSGVDPSAISLHVGNLLPLIALLHCSLHGHNSLVLIGGATGAIGDPSGRSTERSALDMEQLNKNVMAIRTQLYQFFHNAAAYLSRRGLIHATPVMFSPEVSEVGEPLFQDSLNIQILNNYNWFKNVSMLEFLSGVGRYARVNDMLARDSVKSRLFPTNGSIAGISFTEFSYQLMQAHDFSVLHKDKQCSVQLGGSDQMGNIMAGIDLIRRQRAAQADSTANPNMREEPAYGLTLPLLTTASGAKFGKSAGNAVWISSSLLSDFDFYQYFMRSADVDVERYLLSLTLLPIEKIEQIMAEHAQDRSKRIAQRWLASEMTELVRGEKALQKATLATNVLFNTDLQSLTLDQVEFAFENDPRLVYLKEPVEDVIQLATETKLVASRSETRRFIQQKSGLYLNNKSVTDVHAKVSQDELLQGRFIVMRAGRSNHKIIVFPH